MSTEALTDTQPIPAWRLRFESWISAWRPALMLGFGVALAHRVLLGAWMALVWNGFVVRVLGQPVDLDMHYDYVEPFLETPLEYSVFGVWRRWDAGHYFTLAVHGYQASDPGPSVFGLLTPFGFRLFDMILPGKLDFAALVFSTLFFGIALTLLYRLCETYYGSAELGKQAVILTALLPVAFYFSAPMSESLYLACALAAFYFAAHGRYGASGVAGYLTVLARSQGVLMAGAGGLLLLEGQPRDMPIWDRVLDTVRRGWPLVLVPLGYITFVVYRQLRGLPGLVETYYDYSYHFFVDPFTGIWLNIKFLSANPHFLTHPDFITMGVCIVLFGLMLALRPHRRLPLLTFALGHLLLYWSKINWAWGSYDEVWYSMSYTRYSLVVFPLWVAAADLLVKAPKWVRLVVQTILLLVLLYMSMRHVMGISPA